MGRRCQDVHPTTIGVVMVVVLASILATVDTLLAAAVLVDASTGRVTAGPLRCPSTAGQIIRRMSPAVVGYGEVAGPWVLFSDRWKPGSAPSITVDGVGACHGAVVNGAGHLVCETIPASPFFDDDYIDGRRRFFSSEVEAASDSRATSSPRRSRASHVDRVSVVLVDGCAQKQALLNRSMRLTPLLTFVSTRAFAPGQPWSTETRQPPRFVVSVRSPLFVDWASTCQEPPRFCLDGLRGECCMMTLFDALTSDNRTTTIATKTSDVAPPPPPPASSSTAGGSSQTLLNDNEDADVERRMFCVWLTSPFPAAGGGGVTGTWWPWSTCLRATDEQASAARTPPPDLWDSVRFSPHPLVTRPFTTQFVTEVHRVVPPSVVAAADGRPFRIRLGGRGWSRVSFAAAFADERSEGFARPLHVEVGGRDCVVIDKSATRIVCDTRLRGPNVGSGSDTNMSFSPSSPSSEPYSIAIDGGGGVATFVGRAKFSNSSNSGSDAIDLMNQRCGQGVRLMAYRSARPLRFSRFLHSLFDRVPLTFGNTSRDDVVVHDVPCDGVMIDPEVLAAIGWGVATSHSNINATTHASKNDNVEALEDEPSAVSTLTPFQLIRADTVFVAPRTANYTFYCLGTSGAVELHGLLLKASGGASTPPQRVPLGLCRSVRADSAIFDAFQSTEEQTVESAEGSKAAGLGLVSAHIFLRRDERFRLTLLLDSTRVSSPLTSPRDAAFARIAVSFAAASTPLAAASPVRTASGMEAPSRSSAQTGRRVPLLWRLRTSKSKVDGDLRQDGAFLRRFTIAHTLTRVTSPLSMLAAKGRASDIPILADVRNCEGSNAAILAAVEEVFRATRVCVCTTVPGGSSSQPNATQPFWKPWMRWTEAADQSENETVEAPGRWFVGCGATGDGCDRRTTACAAGQPHVSLTTSVTAGQRPNCSRAQPSVVTCGRSLSRDGNDAVLGSSESPVADAVVAYLIRHASGVENTECVWTVAVETRTVVGSEAAADDDDTVPSAAQTTASEVESSRRSRCDTSVLHVSGEATGRPIVSSARLSELFFDPIPASLLHLPMHDTSTADFTPSMLTGWTAAELLKYRQQQEYDQQQGQTPGRKASRVDRHCVQLFVRETLAFGSVILNATTESSASTSPALVVQTTDTKDAGGNAAIGITITGLQFPGSGDGSEGGDANSAGAIEIGLQRLNTTALTGFPKSGDGWETRSIPVGPEVICQQPRCGRVLCSCVAPQRGLPAGFYGVRLRLPRLGLLPTNDDDPTQSFFISFAPSALYPSEASQYGGQALTIHGVGFDTPHVKVAVGRKPCPVLSRADTFFTCRFPDLLTGAPLVNVSVGASPLHAPVEVSFNGFNSSELQNRMTRAAGVIPSTTDVLLSVKLTMRLRPTISSIHPAHGSALDPVRITVSGSDFDYSDAVVCEESFPMSSTPPSSSSSSSMSPPSPPSSSSPLSPPPPPSQSPSFASMLNTSRLASPTPPACRSCRISKRTSTSFVCDVGYLPPGFYRVVTGSSFYGLAPPTKPHPHNGTATGSETLKVELYTSYLLVKSVFPRRIFPTGGATLTVSGFGFREPMEVLVAGTPCILSGLTDTVAVCRLQSIEPGSGPTSGSEFFPSRVRQEGNGSSGQMPSVQNVHITFGGVVPGCARGSETVDAWITAAALETVSVSSSSSPAVSLFRPDSCAHSLRVAFTRDEEVPSVYSVLSQRSGQRRDITFTGRGFAGHTISVFVGPVPCFPVGMQHDDLLSCRLLGLGPTGQHPISLEVAPLGRLRAPATANALLFRFVASVHSVWPTAGSIAGGQNITIEGSGFSLASTVTLAGYPCAVFWRNFTTILCTTLSLPHLREASGPVAVWSNTEYQDAARCCRYTFAMLSTPIVTSVSPVSGGEDTHVTVFGVRFQGHLPADGAYSLFGGVQSSVVIITDDVLNTITPKRLAFSGPVGLFFPDVGNAWIRATFALIPSVSRVEGSIQNVPIQSWSYFGGQVLTVTGAHFPTSSLTGLRVTICGRECKLRTSEVSKLTCETPSVVDELLWNAWDAVRLQRDVLEVTLSALGGNGAPLSHPAHEVLLDTESASTASSETSLPPSVPLSSGGGGGGTMGICATAPLHSVLVVDSVALRVAATSPPLQCDVLLGPATANGPPVGNATDGWAVAATMVAGSGAWSRVAVANGATSVAVGLSAATLRGLTSAASGGAPPTMRSSKWVCFRCAVAVLPSATAATTASSSSSEAAAATAAAAAAAALSGIRVFGTLALPPNAAGRCPVSVSVPGLSPTCLQDSGTSCPKVTYSLAVTSAMTSVVPKGIATLPTPTGGGDTYIVDGANLGSNASKVSVLIDGLPCVPQQVEPQKFYCDARPRSSVGDVGVHKITIAELGTAPYVGPQPPTAVAAFLWSSLFAWANRSAPSAGDIAVIPSGTSILLDVSPPPLTAVIVEGLLTVAAGIPGLTSIRLRTQYLIVRNGGEFRVGSPQRPRTANFTLTLLSRSHAATPSTPYASLSTTRLAPGLLRVERGSRLRLCGPDVSVQAVITKAPPATPSPPGGGGTNAPTGSASPGTPPTSTTTTTATSSSLFGMPPVVGTRTQLIRAARPGDVSVFVQGHMQWAVGSLVAIGRASTNDAYASGGSEAAGGAGGRCCDSEELRNAAMGDDFGDGNGNDGSGRDEVRRIIGLERLGAGTFLHFDPSEPLVWFHRGGAAKAKAPAGVSPLGAFIDFADDVVLLSRVIVVDFSDEIAFGTTRGSTRPGGATLRPSPFPPTWWGYFDDSESDTWEASASSESGALREDAISSDDAWRAGGGQGGCRIEIESGVATLQLLGVEIRACGVRSGDGAAAGRSSGSGSSSLPSVRIGGGDHRGNMVKACSIHHSAGMGLVVADDATHLLVEANVVFRTRGHGLATLGGAVRFARVLNNIVMRSVAASATGEKVASFYFTHPSIDVTGNVVSGAAYAGVWFDLAVTSPLVRSRTSTAARNASVLPISSFTAHPLSGEITCPSRARLSLFDNNAIRGAKVGLVIDTRPADEILETDSQQRRAERESYQTLSQQTSYEPCALECSSTCSFRMPVNLTRLTVHSVTASAFVLPTFVGRLVVSACLIAEAPAGVDIGAINGNVTILNSIFFAPLRLPGERDEFLQQESQSGESASVRQQRSFDRLQSSLPAASSLTRSLRVTTAVAIFVPGGDSLTLFNVSFVGYVGERNEDPLNNENITVSDGSADAASSSSSGPARGPLKSFALVVCAPTFSGLPRCRDGEGPLFTADGVFLAPTAAEVANTADILGSVRRHALVFVAEAENGPDSSGYHYAVLTTDGSFVNFENATRGLFPASGLINVERSAFVFGGRSPPIHENLWDACVRGPLADGVTSGLICGGRAQFARYIVGDRDTPVDAVAVRIVCAPLDGGVMEHPSVAVADSANATGRNPTPTQTETALSDVLVVRRRALIAGTHAVSWSILDLPMRHMRTGHPFYVPVDAAPFSVRLKPRPGAVNGSRTVGELCRLLSAEASVSSSTPLDLRPVVEVSIHETVRNSVDAGAQRAVGSLSKFSFLGLRIDAPSKPFLAVRDVLWPVRLRLDPSGDVRRIGGWTAASPSTLSAGLVFTVGPQLQPLLATNASGGVLLNFPAHAVNWLYNGSRRLPEGSTASPVATLWPGGSDAFGPTVVTLLEATTCDGLVPCLPPPLPIGVLSKMIAKPDGLPVSEQRQNPSVFSRGDSWPTGSVPGNGSFVTVAPSMFILIDGETPHWASLTVEGIVELVPGATLRAGRIVVLPTGSLRTGAPLPAATPPPPTPPPRAPTPVPSGRNTTNMSNGTNSFNGTNGGNTSNGTNVTNGVGPSNGPGTPSDNGTNVAPPPPGTPVSPPPSPSTLSPTGTPQTAGLPTPATRIILGHQDCAPLRLSPRFVACCNQLIVLGRLELKGEQVTAWRRLSAQGGGGLLKGGKEVNPVLVDDLFPRRVKRGRLLVTPTSANASECEVRHVTGLDETPRRAELEPKVGAPGWEFDHVHASQPLTAPAASSPAKGAVAAAGDVSVAAEVAGLDRTVSIEAAPGFACSLFVTSAPDATVTGGFGSPPWTTVPLTSGGFAPGNGLRAGFADLRHVAIEGCGNAGTDTPAVGVAMAPLGAAESSAGASPSFTSASSSVTPSPTFTLHGSVVSNSRGVGLRVGAGVRGAQVSASTVWNHIGAGIHIVGSGTVVLGTLVAGTRWAKQPLNDQNSIRDECASTTTSTTAFGASLQSSVVCGVLIDEPDSGGLTVLRDNVVAGSESEGFCVPAFPCRDLEASSDAGGLFPEAGTPSPSASLSPTPSAAPSAPSNAGNARYSNNLAHSVVVGVFVVSSSAVRERTCTAVAGFRVWRASYAALYSSQHQVLRVHGAVLHDSAIGVLAPGGSVSLEQSVLGGRTPAFQEELCQNPKPLKCVAVAAGATAAHATPLPARVTDEALCASTHGDSTWEIGLLLTDATIRGRGVSYSRDLDVPLADPPRRLPVDEKETSPPDVSLESVAFVHFGSWRCGGRSVALATSSTALSMLAAVVGARNIIHISSSPGQTVQLPTEFTASPLMPSMAGLRCGARHQKGCAPQLHTYIVDTDGSFLQANQSGTIFAATGARMSQACAAPKSGAGALVCRNVGASIVTFTSRDLLSEPLGTAVLAPMTSDASGQTPAPSSGSGGGNTSSPGTNNGESGTPPSGSSTSSSTSVVALQPPDSVSSHISAAIGVRWASSSAAATNAASASPIWYSVELDAIPRHFVISLRFCPPLTDPSAPDSQTTPSPTSPLSRRIDGGEAPTPAPTTAAVGNGNSVDDSLDAAGAGVLLHFALREDDLRPTVWRSDGTAVAPSTVALDPARAVNGESFFFPADETVGGKRVALSRASGEPVTVSTRPRGGSASPSTAGIASSLTMSSLSSVQVFLGCTSRVAASTSTSSASSSPPASGGAATLSATSSAGSSSSLSSAPFAVLGDPDDFGLAIHLLVAATVDVHLGVSLAAFDVDISAALLPVAARVWGVQEVQLSMRPAVPDESAPRDFTVVTVRIEALDTADYNATTSAADVNTVARRAENDLGEALTAALGVGSRVEVIALARGAYRFPAVVARSYFLAEVFAVIIGLSAAATFVVMVFYTVQARLAVVNSKAARTALTTGKSSGIELAEDGTMLWPESEVGPLIDETNPADSFQARQLRRFPLLAIHVDDDPGDDSHSDIAGDKTASGDTAGGRAKRSIVHTTTSADALSCAALLNLYVMPSVALQDDANAQPLAALQSEAAALDAPKPLRRGWLGSNRALTSGVPSSSSALRSPVVPSMKSFAFLSESGKPSAGGDSSFVVGSDAGGHSTVVDSNSNFGSPFGSPKVPRRTFSTNVGPESDHLRIPALMEASASLLEGSVRGDGPAAGAATEPPPVPRSRSRVVVIDPEATPNVSSRRPSELAAPQRSGASSSRASVLVVSTTTGGPSGVDSAGSAHQSLAASSQPQPSRLAVVEQLKKSHTGGKPTRTPSQFTGEKPHVALFGGDDAGDADELDVDATWSFAVVGDPTGLTHDVGRAGPAPAGEVDAPRSTKPSKRMADPAVDDTANLTGGVQAKSTDTAKRGGGLFGRKRRG